jgi:hypothetical protein
MEVGGRKLVAREMVRGGTLTNHVITSYELHQKSPIHAKLLAMF